MKVYIVAILGFAGPAFGCTTLLLAQKGDQYFSARTAHTLTHDQAISYITMVEVPNVYPAEALEAAQTYDRADREWYERIRRTNTEHVRSTEIIATYGIPYRQAYLNLLAIADVHSWEAIEAVEAYNLEELSWYEKLRKAGVPYQETNEVLKLFGPAYLQAYLNLLAIADVHHWEAVEAVKAYNVERLARYEELRKTHAYEYVKRAMGHDS